MRWFLVILLTLSYLKADNDIIASINKTLQKVITESKNKTVTDVEISYDPFHAKIEKPVVHKKNKTSVSKTQPQKQSLKLTLSMIFNKKAFINGQWYKVNDKFADYRVTKINQDIVVLRKKNKYTTLKLSVSDSILVTKEEI